MWLATKYAADRPKLPPLALLNNELGMKDAIKYRRLVDQHEDVRRGPDETISDHYARLQHANSQWRNEDTTDADRRARDPRAKGVVDNAANTPAWATRFQEPAAAPERAPEAGPGGTPAGLPQRIPGWYTGDAVDTPPPGFGTPAMPKRTPGDSMRSPNSPNYAPEPQSVQDWVSSMREKGITLNQALQRPDAVNNQVPPPPMRRGQDIWSDFVPRGLGDRTPPQSSSGAGSLLDRAKSLLRPRRTRTASTVVAEYIEGVLIDLGELPSKTASRVHDVMTGDGWSHHESGSGDYYQKKIGDKIHRVVRQEDGWIHNSGPADQEPDEYGDIEMTGKPLMTDDIHNAIMRANRSQVQVGFRPPPIGQQSLSSTSWSDER